MGRNSLTLYGFFGLSSKTNYNDQVSVQQPEDVEANQAEAEAKAKEKHKNVRLETILGLFASFVLEIETIQQIVRWDMKVLRESPWFQEILEEGLKQGREEGVLQGQRESILNLLRSRFYLQAETNEVLAGRLARVDSSETLQTLVIAAAQAESLAAFIERLDEIAPLAVDEGNRGPDQLA